MGNAHPTFRFSVKSLTINYQLSTITVSIQTLNLSPQLYEYLLSVSLRESEILEQIRMESRSHPLAQGFLIKIGSHFGVG